MEYKIRNARWEDLPRIEEIYAYARRFMAETGNRKELLFVLIHENLIRGVFYFFIGPDPTYGIIEDGNWRSDTPYGTIHRIAGDGSGGILAAAVGFAKDRINHIRIDTHADNKIMQHAVAKQGFLRSGIIHLENGSPRIAYDLLTAE